MMATHRLDASPLGRDRCHVVVSDMGTGRVQLCGSITLEWLTNVPEKEHQASVALGPVEWCDHGGTYNEPRSIFTGQLAP